MSLPAKANGTDRRVRSGGGRDVPSTFDRFRSRQDGLEVPVGRGPGIGSEDDRDPEHRQVAEGLLLAENLLGGDLQMPANGEMPGQRLNGNDPVASTAPSVTPMYPPEGAPPHLVPANPVRVPQSDCHFKEASSSEPGAVASSARMPRRTSSSHRLLRCARRCRRHRSRTSSFLGSKERRRTATSTSPNVGDSRPIFQTSLRASAPRSPCIIVRSTS